MNDTQDFESLPSQIRSSRCLFTLCLSVRDMASHGARRTVARHSTAGTSPPQPRILTRFRHLVHRQHCSPGHTALAHTPARRENISISIYKVHAICWVYTHTHTTWISRRRKTLKHGKALRNPCLQSHSASCSQRTREAAGDRDTENQWITQRFCWRQSGPFALKSDSLQALNTPFSAVWSVFPPLTNTYLKFHQICHIPHCVAFYFTLAVLPETKQRNIYSLKKKRSKQTWMKIVELASRWFIIWQMEALECYTWLTAIFCNSTFRPTEGS